MKRYKIIISLAAIICGLMIACDNTDYSNKAPFDNMVYIKEASNSNSERVTFRNTLNEQKRAFSAKLTYPAGKDIVVKLKADPGLINEFNARHGTDYGMLDSKYYSLSNSELIIKAEKSESLIDTIYFNNLLDLEIDKTYLVPAFSGLGAPYWDSRATAAVVGMTRTTKKPELVKAAVECIAYQITDIVNAMSEDAGVKVEELRVDGGPTRNSYLMQFQSDMTRAAVQVPDAEELLQLAKDAGLEVAPFGAVVVDEHMRTTDPSIYAGGDCVAIKNIITGKMGYLPLGSMANRQGRIIGTNLAGGNAMFGVMDSLRQQGVVSASLLNASAGWLIHPLDLPGLAVLLSAGKRVAAVCKPAVFGALAGIALRTALHALA